MTDRVLLDDDEKRAKAEAKTSAFEDAWAVVAKATPGGIVRALGGGRVHVHAQGRSFVVDRGDLPALEAAVAMLRSGGR